MTAIEEVVDAVLRAVEAPAGAKPVLQLARPVPLTQLPLECFPQSFRERISTLLLAQPALPEDSSTCAEYTLF